MQNDKHVIYLDSGETSQTADIDISGISGTMFVYFDSSQPANAQVDLVLVPFNTADADADVAAVISSEQETNSVATATKTEAVLTDELVIVNIADSGTRYAYTGKARLKVTAAAPGNIVISLYNVSA
jgi:hypothetical protein